MCHIAGAESDGMDGRADGWRVIKAIRVNGITRKKVLNEKGEPRATPGKLQHSLLILLARSLSRGAVQI